MVIHCTKFYWFSVIYADTSCIFVDSRIHEVGFIQHARIHWIEKFFKNDDGRNFLDLIEKYFFVYDWRGSANIGLFVRTGNLIKSKNSWSEVFRTAFFFPYVTSLVAIAVVWNMLFHPTMGPINQFLKLFIANPPGWVSSSQWALTAIIIVSVWRGMGYYMILYLAGLQSISKELYEAAAMDGANKWKQFVNITVPALRPTTFFVTIMLVINCFKIFDLVQVMTDGGPGRATNVLVYHVYNEAFVKFNFGYASAIAMILFVIVLAITVIQFKWNQVQERV